jgi:hypothetical protein
MLAGRPGVDVYWLPCRYSLDADMLRGWCGCGVCATEFQELQGREILTTACVKGVPWFRRCHVCTCSCA